jgi:hypothetical protein
MKNALVAAVVAAVVAAASGTAATMIVTSKNIKNGTIQTVDISAAAKRALKGNRGPQGFQGASGAQGAAGAPGPPGPPPGIQSLTKVVVSTPVPPGEAWRLTALCPAGQTAVSGGVAFPDEIWESQQKPIGGDGWTVTGVNNTTDVTFTLYAIAHCSANVRLTATEPTASSALQKAARADTSAALKP